MFEKCKFLSNHEYLRIWKRNTIDNLINGAPETKSSNVQFKLFDCASRGSDFLHEFHQKKKKRPHLKSDRDNNNKKKQYIKPGPIFLKI